MELARLIEAIGARVLASGPAQEADIEDFCASDRISDLLNHASSRTLLVTSLTGAQVLRVCELMSVPAICFAGDTVPPDEAVQAAARSGCETALLVSPADMAETCRRVAAFLTRRG